MGGSLTFLMLVLSIVAVVILIAFSLPFLIHGPGVVLFVCLGGYVPFNEDMPGDGPETTLPELILAAKYAFIGPYWPRISDSGMMSFEKDRSKTFKYSANFSTIYTIFFTF